MIERLVKSLENQLNVKDFKLNSLLEVTSAINANAGVDQLIKIYEFILKEQLGFQRFILFNEQEGWNCLLKIGFKGSKEGARSAKWQQRATSFDNKS